MGAVGVNGAEAGRSSCGVPETGEKMKTKSLRGASWQKVAADKVLQGSGTQQLQTYLYRSQVAVI